jgi:hypothetical protein
MILDKFNVFINKIENLAKDPERFLTNKYQRYRNPNGFRIELYTHIFCQQGTLKKLSAHTVKKL